MSKFGSNGSQIQGLFAFERVYWKISIERRERDKTNIGIFPFGFYIFSDQSYFFGPQYLLDHDIVLVNFHLDILGFVSTRDFHASGNLGLKCWFRRNIERDPNSVTISGCSFSYLSVWLHILPMSTNLFHKTS